MRIGGDADDSVWPFPGLWASLSPYAGGFVTIRGWCHEWNSGRSDCPVLKIRRFLNTDAPSIIDLWRKHPPFPRLSSTISKNDLENLVLAKPYFDPEGFRLALDDGLMVGFAHAGFGPNSTGSDLDYRNGLLLQVRSLPGEAGDSVAEALIDSCLDYLQSRGAQRCFAASRFPWVPFYLGLYGGSRIPGIPVEDQAFHRAVAQRGFVHHDRIEILQRTLAGFRVPVDRALRNLRREYQVNAIVDPKLGSWWDYCTYGTAEMFQFRLVDRRDQSTVGSVMFWEIQPLSSEWRIRSVGLCDLEIRADLRGRGLGRFLVGQALSQLQQQIGRCEVQLRASDEAMLRLVSGLGFERDSHGIEMVRSLVDPSGTDGDQGRLTGSPIMS